MAASRLHTYVLLALPLTTRFCPPPPAALLALKASLDPSGQALALWKAPTPYCQWAYIVCDSAGNVARLTLSFIGLSGSLPPASALQGLPQLKVRVCRAPVAVR